MQTGQLAPRLRHLPRRRVLGLEVPVALGPRARLLGLAHLDRNSAARGLLIPRCASVHTFGMRFKLDIFFLGDGDEVLDVRRCVPPRRVSWRRGAVAVLELPSPAGGEIGAPGA
jgi:uncharacterized protein